MRSRMPQKSLLAFTLLCSAAVAQQSGEVNQRALELVNQSRQKQGLAPLTAGANLDEAARAHAEDMLERDYYAHQSPEGDTVRDRYLSAGGSEWELVAENIARCQGCEVPADISRVEAFHEGWMNSPGHRRNILAEGLARFGFGIASGGQTVYAVQTFAGPGISRGGEGGGPVDNEAAAQLALELINDARREAGLTPLEIDRDLQDAAASLVPEDLQGFALDRMGTLQNALAPDAWQDWRRLASVAGSCGGCGIEPVAGDVRPFVSDWLKEGGAYRQQILDPDLTHAGMILRADGQGRKIVLLLLAERS